MRGLWKLALVVVSLVVLLPAAAFAQAGIAGTVKDASGGVLPGVTVEAASPALIEKTRSVVTDGAGNYKIENLRPGTYTVTFSLSGFNTLKREDIELTGTFVAAVNAEMKVGAVEESITVTGETPLVDVQGTSRQAVFSKEVIESVPTGRSYSAFGTLIPGIKGADSGVNIAADVGGMLGGGMGSMAIHGGNTSDQRILQNGLSVSGLISGSTSGAIPNQSGAQEVTIDTAAGTAERQTGGVTINFIQRDGGNTFKSYTFATYGGDGLYEANNLTSRLVTGPYGAPGVTNAPGVSSVNSLVKTWEVNPSLGGPIVRDTLWFYYSMRYQRALNTAAGSFVNANAFVPTAWTYNCLPNAAGQCTTEPGMSKDGTAKDSQLRMTWQVAPKVKLAGTWDSQSNCTCPYQVSNGVAVEAARGDFRFPTQNLYHAELLSPVTSRVLIEAVGLVRGEGWGWNHLQPASVNDGSFDRYFPPAAYANYPLMIGVLEQNPVNGQLAGFAYRGPQTSYNKAWSPQYSYRGAVSYVTGTHAVKVGLTDTWGYVSNSQYFVGPPLVYRTRSATDANGKILAADGLPTPNQVTIFATPYTVQNNQDHDIGLYAQDKWTVNRLTLNYGLRFDWFKSSFPDQDVPASSIFAGTNLPRATGQLLTGAENLNWKDITPRFGGAYDVRGNGKTAIKFSVNKFVAGQTGNQNATTNPVSRLQNSASRTWTDTNRNMAVDCDMLATAANGECGAFTGANANFGTYNATALPNDNFRAGWNKRGYNWEFSGGVQHELLPNVSIDVSYFRRIFGNFTVNDNLAYDTTCGTPTDHSGCYNSFSVIAPVDSRLGDVSGQTIAGVYDLKAQNTAITPKNATILVNGENLGGAKQYNHWNGVDFYARSRLRQGILLQGGLSTGRTYVNNCDVVNRLPESTAVAPPVTAVSAILGVTPTANCSSTTPFLTSVSALGSYTIPKVDLQLSGSFRSTPTSALTAVYTINAANRTTNTDLAGAIQAPGGNIFVNLLSAGTNLYQERINDTDLRFAKILKYRSSRATVSVDLYNLFNADAITSVSPQYETLWRPTGVLQARFLKLSAQFDF